MAIFFMPGSSTRTKKTSVIPLLSVLDFLKWSVNLSFSAILKTSAKMLLLRTVSPPNYLLDSNVEYHFFSYIGHQVAVMS